MSKLNWLSRALIYGPRLLLCTDEIQFIKALKEIGQVRHEFLPDAEGMMTYTYINTDVGGIVCIICMDIDHWVKQPSLDTAMVLVHESVHVWQHFKDYIGEAEPSKEFEAYAIGNISRALMEAYCEQATRASVGDRE